MTPFSSGVNHIVLKVFISMQLFIVLQSSQILVVLWKPFWIVHFCRIRFTVVSEPPEDEQDADCEDVGVAYVSVRDILKNKADLKDADIDSKSCVLSLVLISLFVIWPVSVMYNCSNCAAYSMIYV